MGRDRFAQLKTDVDGIMQVVKWVDALEAEETSVRALVARAAELAGCPVGYQEGQRRCLWFDADGRPCEEPSTQITDRAVGPFGVVMMSARDGWFHPLHRILLERLVHVAGNIAAGPPRSQFDDLALVERVLSSKATEFERSGALRLLHFAPDASLCVGAVSGPPDVADRIAEQLSVSAHSQVRRVGRLFAVLTTRDIPAYLDLPLGSRIGISPLFPAIDAPQAWRLARAALRFTVPNAPQEPVESVVVHWDTLGSFQILAEPELMSSTTDIIALDALADAQEGNEMIRTLEVVAATESIRGAAVTLYLHHSSVASRIRRAEHVLGFTVSSPYSRARLMVGLVLRRLRDNP